MTMPAVMAANSSAGSMLTAGALRFLERMPWRDASCEPVTGDGWAALSLTGDGARRAFARLSDVELPESGYTQGDVAHVPGRVLVEEERIQLLVPAMWGPYLRERLLALGAREDGS